jgi:hypothetical protein
MSDTLNTQNPEAITYKSADITFTVLGGIRTENLDRMRVTLKVAVTDRKFTHYLNNPEIASLALRHNLDLYNDTQVEKLVRKTADRLEVGISAVSKALAELTTELENYRLTLIEQKKKESGRIIKPLTEEQRTTAENFLQSEKLIEKTQELIGKSGVVGEAGNRLLLYLVFTSRKMLRPLHAISFGSSGTGKSHLQEKVGELMPEEDKIEITSLTENAFYYFGQQELRHRLILIEDLDGAENVLYPLRELQSKRSITKTLTVKNAQGNTKTETLKVEGPVSVAGCTTKESVYEDNANRSFLLYLDESKEQDERVMQYQRDLSAGAIDTAAEHAAKTLLKNAQRILQPVTVRNPYAQLLKLPEGVFKPRRTNAHYLQFIEAVTFYHQLQREQKADEHSGEIYIETTIEDIETANELMQEVLLRKSDELPKSCRLYFEQVKAWLKIEQKQSFNAKEIRFALRINHGNQKRWMLQLLQNGYIRKSQRKQGAAAQYEVVSYEEYAALQSNISTVLNDIVQHVRANSSPSGRPGGAPERGAHEPTSSQPVHSMNEPLKEVKTRKPRKQTAVLEKEIHPQANKQSLTN